jgi:flagellar biosynthesis/type III secretory pathway chaperone
MLALALAVAGCAAYFSVWGLSQLFAGASTSVIIMASILELSKIVTTTALHTYWDKLAKSLKVYLSISVVILMIITSAGIYGFLSNAYQKTANKLEIHEGELGILDGKKQIFEKSVSDNQKIIETKTKRLDQLSNLRTTQESRLDGSKSNRARNSVRTDISNANSEIQKLTKDIDDLNAKNAILSDSIGAYNVKGLEMKSTSDVAGEIGPLKYIAELTDTPMANIVNYLILLLVFVFDPLAVALVLATNKVFELQGEELPLEPKKDSTKEILEDILDELKHEDETESEPIFENVPEPIEENNVKQEPVVSTGKLQLEDIKEKREGRGFSVNIPDGKSSNVIERIGANKVVKNGDNNKVYFKRE